MRSRDAYLLAVSMLRNEGEVTEYTFTREDGTPYLLASLDVDAPHEEAPDTAARLARLAVSTHGYLTMLVHEDRAVVHLHVTLDLVDADERRAA